MCRYSASRLVAMKNAPIIQYDTISDTGGKRSLMSGNHPSKSRTALFADSLTTSRYGHSFVRTGGTLYATPSTHRSAADAKKYLLIVQATASPAAPTAIHSA